MNVGGSFAEHVTNVLLLLPSFAVGGRLSNGATPQHAASDNIRYNDLDTESNKQQLLSPAGQSSGDNIDTGDNAMVSGLDKDWDSIPRRAGQEGSVYDMVTQPEDHNYIHSAHTNVLDWIGTLRTSDRHGRPTEGGYIGEDGRRAAVDDSDSGAISAMSWFGDISDQQRQHGNGSVSHHELSMAARSKRTVQAISASSLSGSPQPDYPAEHNRLHDAFAKKIRNLTKDAANTISETLQNSLSINGTEGRQHERGVSTGSQSQGVGSASLSQLVGSASLTKSNLTLLDDGHVSLNDVIDLSQSESSLHSSHSTSSVTSSYTGSGITGLLNTAASDMSTQFPGFINLSNISLDGANMSGLYPGGIVDHYLGNYTSDCLDWALNGTCLYGNTTLSNSTNTSAMNSPPPIRLWALFLFIFPLFTVFGNILVVLSVYKERSLRTVTNYFIVSLAIADIMVAVLVMPLAVYVEVYNQHWTLGDALCDTWVAFDVMCCTASILNLTAISVDRFIAVTQPMKYARHKNSNRVWVMLVLTWVVSIAISSPIALGMNYTERRDPNMCVFYNSDFLIYSSMGSFYIPCLIMVLLYWRIFRAIRMRAKKQAKKHKPLPRSLNVIENKAQTGRTTSDASATEDCHKELLPAGNSAAQARSLIRTPIAEETSFTNYNAKLHTTTDNSGEESSHSQSQSQGEVAPIRGPISDDDGAHVIPNNKSTDFMLSATSDDNGTATNHRIRDVESGYAAPTHVVVETHTSGDMTSPVMHKTLLSPPPRRPIMTSGIGVKNHAPGKRLKRNNNKDSPKKSVTKFNFHLHRTHSRKKKEGNRTTASRRERKATKTLAIVLGVFLLCWVPFFTVNIMNAICIRFDLFDRPECNIDGMLFSFFVWLGYINSFLNPVIYTIFNIEFRRAFKKLLNQPCK